MNKRMSHVLSNVLRVSAALLIVGASDAAFAQQPAAPLPASASRAHEALARLEFNIDARIVPPQRQIGQGICIDASKGIFVTFDVPLSVPTGEMKDFVLVTPGAGGKRIKAEFMGANPELGITFIRAVEKHNWSQVRFASSSNLQLGQRVFSVGLLGPQTGNIPYVGAGAVSAVLRLPQRLVYVSGGDLTVASSPVFSADGRAVGIVGRQMPINYRMLLAERWTEIGLAGRQATRFFMPSEEFANTLANREMDRKIPWLGVLKFHALLPEQAELNNLTDTPAVLVGRVIKDSPAGKAGLEQGDAIVAFEGKPLERMATANLTVAQFERRLVHCEPGQTISLMFQRKGNKRTVQVTLAEMPPRPNEAKRYYDRRLGMTARDMVFWDYYALRNMPMVGTATLVTMVRKESPAGKGGLRPGDLITAVNDQPIKSSDVLGDVLGRLAQSGGGKPINFMIQRGDKTEAIVVTPK